MHLASDPTPFLLDMISYINLPLTYDHNLSFYNVTSPPSSYLLHALPLTLSQTKLSNIFPLIFALSQGTRKDWNR